MPDASRFRRLPEGDAPTVSFRFEGAAVEAREGDTVAAALLAAGHRALRTTPVGGAPRGAFCMMGVCFDCLVEIDGEANRQACQVVVRDGMCVRRMVGARTFGMEDGDD